MRFEGPPPAPSPRAWALRIQHTDTRLQEREPRDVQIRARRVILAAGALGSPEILMRSRTEELVLSPTLGESFSGNGDDIAAIYKVGQTVHGAADEDIPPDRRKIGPTITASVEMKRRPDDPLHGARPFLIEEFAVPGPMRRLFEEVVTTGHMLSQVPVGDFSRHDRSKADPMAVDQQAMEETLIVGVIGHDDAQGSLRLARQERLQDEAPQIGTLRIHWPNARWGREMDAAHDSLADFAEPDHPSRDSGFLRETCKALSSYFGRAPEETCPDGPRLVSNPVWRLLPPGLDDLVSQPRGPIMTVHPLGGCRMGVDGKVGVVDRYGRVFNAHPAALTHPARSLDDKARQDANNSWANTLVVLDGSIIGASLGVNPSLTIAALALAAMDELLTTKEWSGIGQPTGNPETTPTVPPVAGEDCKAPPLPPPTSLVPEPPLKTEVEVFERLVSEPLSLKGCATPVIAELTLAYEKTAMATLMAPARKPIGVLPDVSYLRLYDATQWRVRQLKQRDDDERIPDLLAEAGIKAGSLRFLHRGESTAGGRTWTGLSAWARNRGKRDSWQRYVEGHLTPQGRKRLAAADASRPAWIPAIGFWTQFWQFFYLASHAGQQRLFDYDLTLGPARKDKGQAEFASLLQDGQTIKAFKRLRYERRSNPWHQLTRARLSEFPGLSPAGDPDEGPVLKVDTRYFARKEVPLLRVASQRNHAEALAEMMSFGMYLLRVMIDVHLWTFRKPDRRRLRDIYRLPPPLPGLPDPQVTMLAVDRWPEASLLEDQPVMIRLTRYPMDRRVLSDKPPLVMIHGYSASGTTFAHPSLDKSAAEYFWEQGRDVWIVDLRTSCGLESARYEWSMEQAGLIDIPAALLHVRNATGQRVDVLAHCIGGAMLGMALLADARSIRSGDTELGVDTWLSSEQLGLLNTFNGSACAADGHPVVRRVILSQKGPVMRYTDENVLRAYVLQFARRFLMAPDYRFEPSRSPMAAEQLMDRFLAGLPYEDPDFDRENPCPPWAKTSWTATRHRLDALFGKTFLATNLKDETLEAIDDFFGPINLDTVSQTIHFAKWDAITNQRGRGEFLTRGRLHERWKGIRTMAIHGAENGLVDPFTLTLARQEFGNAGITLHDLLIPDTGHQDCLIGRGAESQVFDKIEAFLSDASVPEAEEPPKGLAVEPCWIGPRLVMPQGSWPPDRNWPPGQIAAMSRPDRGRGVLWLVPAVEIRDAKADATGYRIISGGSAIWCHSQPGSSLDWLRAAPCIEGMPAATDTETPGWLCLMVHPLDETRADRSNLPVPLPMMDIARTPNPAAAAAIQATSPGSGPLPSSPRSGAPAGGPSYRSDTQPKPECLPPGMPPPVASVQAWLAMQTDRQICAEIFVSLGDFARAQALPTATGLSFAFGSCQYSGGLFDRGIAGRSLSGVADAGTGVAMALMIGDQIYADATAGLVDPTRRDERYELPHQRAFRLADMRRVMRRMPVQMLLDDHELFDNWQPLPVQLDSPLPPPPPALPPLKAFVDDSPSPHLKRLRKRFRDAMNFGVMAFAKFQRMESYAAGFQDLDFVFSGHAFYLLDTRTRRQRGFPGKPAEGGIIHPLQQARLTRWLLDKENVDRVKFIATPSLFLPRRKETANQPGNACRSDAWDGFPASMRWLLELVAEHRIRKLVMLSGDEHHSLHSEIFVGPEFIKVVSVHSSGFYAPYPFANGRPTDLQQGFPTTADCGPAAVASTVDAPPGDGFAVIEVLDFAETSVLEDRISQGRRKPADDRADPAMSGPGAPGPVRSQGQAMRLQGQQAVEQQRLDQLMRHRVQRRRHLPARAAGHQGQRLVPGALLQVPVHALDRAGDGVVAAAGQRVGGVGRELAHLAGGHAQAGGAAFERAQHDAVARQDQAAEEVAVGIDGIDGHRRADHHDQAGARCATVQHVPARADMGDEAVRTEARRVVIAVDHAAAGGAGDDPARRDVPQFQLLLDAAAHRIAGHIAAQHAVRGRQAFPVAIAELLDVLQEHGTVGEHHRTGLGRGVEGPFQAGVADVDGQKAHG